MLTLLRDGSSVADTARMLTMSEKTVRKYRDSNVLPSQIERPQRTYRTRNDPLEQFWPEVQERLENDHRLKPYALLQWLQQKYNSADDDTIVPDSIRRTLERRVQNWKLQNDVNKEVIFPQIHHPGDVVAFDFVDLNCLKVTIAGKQFDHKLFHAVLTYSNWEHVHICHSESFEALATGLQDALHLAGGVPKRVRSDSLSAAVNNLSSDKEFAKQYQNLLSHYGLQGHRINVRKPQENGDVESSNGHIKTAIDQSLRLRGNRDFGDHSQYRDFLLEVVGQRNFKRDVKLLEEVAQFRSLPAQRVATYTTLDRNVKSDCVLRIKRNSYSVSSKYIGLAVEIQIHQDHV
ncbi:IS21 family transposase [Stieleria sp. ICT_E10.1]|uniref:IS21 family transposase n=1 Tax=Stieleria sedimenti TaxID=2976331 RepID=UPI00217F6F3E|nr:IS21 family transposase [Stieleria sedimenti]MCS7469198.1 IS21 family transposase [Stieleria sedimenti]